jgi:uncharacterized membrane protein (UPF0127 family)
MTSGGPVALPRLARLPAAVLGLALVPAVVLGLVPVPARGAAPQTASSPAVVASCANPALPSAILDGPPAVNPAVGAPPATPAGGPLPMVDARGARVTLLLAVAANDNDRDLGLMCVTRLARGHGMIFVFAANARWVFWMKNTLVPLDMLWLTDDGRVTAVAADVPASTLQTPDAEVARRAGTGRFVIELPAGEAGRDGLVVGSHLRLPKLQAQQ